jgi:hypothetical protein
MGEPILFYRIPDFVSFLKKDGYYVIVNTVCYPCVMVSYNDDKETVTISYEDSSQTFVIDIPFTNVKLVSKQYIDKYKIAIAKYTNKTDGPTKFTLLANYNSDHVYYINSDRYVKFFFEKGEVEHMTSLFKKIPVKFNDGSYLTDTLDYFAVARTKGWANPGEKRLSFFDIMKKGEC